MRFANVIIDISHEKLDRPFGYIIPQELEDKIEVGMAVNIPFGRGNRLIKGYVIEVTDKPGFDINKMKAIDSVVEDTVDVQSELIGLAWWIRENYGSTMNRALKTVIPVKTKVKNKVNKTVKLNIEKEEIENKINLYKKKNAKARIRLLNELKENDEISFNLVTDKLNISSGTLKTMQELGDIEIIESVHYRNPVRVNEKEYDIVLNDGQRKVADSIIEAMRAPKEDKKPDVHLIFGVTGSGKTEVYMELIDKALEDDKEVIVLIPEISLTYQTVMRFTKKFKDKVSIINSKMSKGERYDQFERAKKGDVKIMVGPRSALFTPFRNLGLIIIDEEHDGAYKSESVPKYHAIEVATKRAVDNKASLVLGSATPSVESYYRASKGIYKLHKLESRHSGQLPKVHIVDLREELKNGNKTIFSQKLTELIKDRLEKKEQTMLFINRRGLAGFVSCRDCGKPIKCPHCDVSLKLHRGKLLKCHYCGYEVNLLRKCQHCGSTKLGSFGIGTQQVETMLKEMFPKARVLRMDADSTSLKGSHESILQSFANHDADILLGTQMIVKGHDFPKVTLVGALAADMSLYSNNYSATEATFQLLTQAVGRAGRSSIPGEAVIQTYSPDHYSIVAASHQDYNEFYQQEISYRELMMYPPTATMASILLMSKNYNELSKAAEYAKVLMADKNEKYLKDVMIIGPADPAINKINDVYRKIIYFRSENRFKLIALKNYLETVINSSQKFNNINVQFDFNVK